MCLQQNKFDTLKTKNEGKGTHQEIIISPLLFSL